MMEAKINMALAAVVPAHVVVMGPKTEEAALNMVWDNTHIKTPLFPDILKTAPKKNLKAMT